MKKLLLLLPILAACTSNAPTSSNVNDTIVTEYDTPKVPNTWEYNENEDKMTSKKEYFANVDADELIDFQAPYDGGSIATITLRSKRGVTDVMLAISKGQFTNTLTGGEINVRFGENSATKYSTSGASSGSSDVIFINNTKSFINNLKKNKKVIIECEFYREGNKQMEFNIENLVWPH